MITSPWAAYLDVLEGWIADPDSATGPAPARPTTAIPPSLASRAHDVLTRLQEASAELETSRSQVQAEIVALPKGTRPAGSRLARPATTPSVATRLDVSA